MIDYLTLFETESAYENYIQNDPLLPNVSYCKNTGKVCYVPIHDYSQDYLTFVALEDGTFQLNNYFDINYSLDDGNTWVLLTAGTSTPVVTAGNKIMWKGNIIPASPITTHFTSTGKFDVQGNIQSLFWGDDFSWHLDYKGNTHTFNGLFATEKVVNAKNLILPASSIGLYCYFQMFKNCTELITAPQIYGYRIPVSSFGYQEMFAGCTKLIAAPDLYPIESPSANCFKNMFANCTSLNYIKAMFHNPDNATSGWLANVAETGTFITDSTTGWSEGASGIPTGWTVEIASAE